MWPTAFDDEGRFVLSAVAVVALVGCGEIEDRPRGGATNLDGPAIANERGDAAGLPSGPAAFCLNPGAPGGGPGGGRGGGDSQCNGTTCLTCPGDGSCYACTGEAAADSCLTGPCDACKRVGDDTQRCLKCNDVSCFVCPVEAQSCTPPSCPGCAAYPNQ